MASGPLRNAEKGLLDRCRRSGPTVGTAGPGYPRSVRVHGVDQHGGVVEDVVVVKPRRTRPSNWPVVTVIRNRMRWWRHDGARGRCRVATVDAAQTTWSTGSVDQPWLGRSTRGEGSRSWPRCRRSRSARQARVEGGGEAAKEDQRAGGDAMGVEGSGRSGQDLAPVRVRSAPQCGGPGPAGGAGSGTAPGGRRGCQGPTGRAGPLDLAVQQGRASPASRLFARVLTGPRVESRCTVARPSSPLDRAGGQPEALGPLVGHDVHRAGEEPVPGHEHPVVRARRLRPPPQRGPQAARRGGAGRAGWRRGRCRRAPSPPGRRRRPDRSPGPAWSTWCWRCRRSRPRSSAPAPSRTGATTGAGGSGWPGCARGERSGGWWRGVRGGSAARRATRRR